MSVGVELASVNTISNNAPTSMLPQVMPAAVQVLRLYRQNVVGIQVSSHLKQQAQGLHIVMKQKKRKDYAFWRQIDEKPSIIPSCPDTHCGEFVSHGHSRDKEHKSSSQKQMTTMFQ